MGATITFDAGSIQSTRAWVHATEMQALAGAACEVMGTTLYYARQARADAAFARAWHAFGMSKPAGSSGRNRALALAYSDAASARAWRLSIVSFVEFRKASAGKVA